MPRLLRRLVREEQGFLVTTEWAFVATILMLGAVSGLAACRHPVLDEAPTAARVVKPAK